VSLKRRVSRLESQHGNGSRPAQQILIYPTELDEAALHAWIAEQRNRQPDAMLIFLPQKGLQP
jgi:hypothetical protein